MIFRESILGESRTQAVFRFNSTMSDRTSSKRNMIPTAPLPDPIGNTIDTIIELRTRAEQKVSRPQRIVEMIIEFLGRPVFLYGVMIVLVLWFVLNLFPTWGLQFDPPPFQGLDITVGVLSLLMTTGVLVRQGRQEQLAEQRAQLNLQLDLITEQKIAKLIALVEELRRDLPNVRDRLDPEAEAMRQAVDPYTVLETLEETLNSELVELQSKAEVDQQDS